MSAVRSSLFEQQQMRCNESCESLCEKVETETATVSDSDENLFDEDGSQYSSDNEEGSSSGISSSYSDSSSYVTENDSDDSEDEGAKVKAAVDAQHGLFLSMEMVELLRRRTSVGNLLTHDAIFEKMIPKKVPRRQSVCGASTDIVYAAMQTKSCPVESLPGHHDEVVAKPKEVLAQILASHGYSTVATPFSTLTTWVVGCNVSYNMTLMEAVRQNDLEAIRAMHKAGCNLQCCNKWGETILHAVARHGRLEILQFLIEETGVSMRVCCDGGRTILHDGAWTGTPNWGCISYILKSLPELLTIADKRGTTPLDFIPKEAWAAWNLFLENNQDLIVPAEILY